jgi:hypothetical protein
MRVIEILWQLVVCNKLQPRGGHWEHLLWALFFVKVVYPKQGLGCLAICASARAADPKTHRKWVWVFIDAIADLVDVAVSKIAM